MKANQNILIYGGATASRTLFESVSRIPDYTPTPLPLDNSVPPMNEDLAARLEYLHPVAQLKAAIVDTTYVDQISVIKENCPNLPIILLSQSRDVRAERQVFPTPQDTLDKRLRQALKEVIR
jgi:hypothetical protein